MSKRHVVREGEYLSLIARRHGFVTDKALREANADLFASRRDPNVLNPGDELVIPDKRIKLVPRVTEKVHEHRLKGQEDRLRLLLKDEDGDPLASQAFKLRVQSSMEAPASAGLEITGQTGGDGRIDVPLPRGAVRAHLSLDETPWLSWELLIGHLDPTHDEGSERRFVKGVQARLYNLGFRCGPADGDLGPRTRAALARFQRKVMHRADASGDLDTPSCEALRKSHGA